MNVVVARDRRIDVGVAEHLAPDLHAALVPIVAHCAPPVIATRSTSAAGGCQVRRRDRAPRRSPRPKPPARAVGRSLPEGRASAPARRRRPAPPAYPSRPASGRNTTRSAHHRTARAARGSRASAPRRSRAPRGPPATAAAAPPAKASASGERLPLRLPGAGARSCSCGAAATSTPACRARARRRRRAPLTDADRIALVRHRRGAAARPPRAPRRPRSARAGRRRARSSRTPRRPPRAPRRARQRVLRSCATAATGSRQLELAREQPHHLARRRRRAPQRAGRPAELRAQARSRTWASRARAVEHATSQPAAFRPKVVGTACCSSVRPAIGVARCASASAAHARPRRRAQPTISPRAPPGDEHRRGVDDVLARRPEVDEAGRLAADGLPQRAHQRLGRVPRRRAPPRADASMSNSSAPAALGDRRRPDGPGRPRRAPRAFTSARSASSIAASHARSDTAARSSAGTKSGSKASQREEHRLAGRPGGGCRTGARRPRRRRDERRAPRLVERATSTGSAAFASTSSGKYIRVTARFSSPRANTPTSRCGACSPPPATAPPGLTVTNAKRRPSRVGAEAREAAESRPSARPARRACQISTSASGTGVAGAVEHAPAERIAPGRPGRRVGSTRRAAGRCAGTAPRSATA